LPLSAPVDFQHLLPSSNPINRYTDYLLRTQESGCNLCRLGSTREKIVVSRGNPMAPFMFIAEAPGAEEDKIGKVLIGRAGKLQDSLLEQAGISQESCFFRNTVMCRPPSNRKPELDEQEACKIHYAEMMQIAQPKIVIALGKTPAVYLGMMQLHEKMKDKVGKIKLSEDGMVYEVIMYHPSFLLRPNGKSFIDSQIELLKKFVDYL
jgi:uracil-DNA glycosylase